MHPNNLLMTTSLLMNYDKMGLRMRSGHRT